MPTWDDLIATYEEQKHQAKIYIALVALKTVIDIPDGVVPHNILELLEVPDIDKIPNIKELTYRDNVINLLPILEKEYVRRRYLSIIQNADGMIELINQLKIKNFSNEIVSGILRFTSLVLPNNTFCIYINYSDEIPQSYELRLTIGKDTPEIMLGYYDLDRILSLINDFTCQN